MQPLSEGEQLQAIEQRRREAGPADDFEFEVYEPMRQSITFDDLRYKNPRFVAAAKVIYDYEQEVKVNRATALSGTKPDQMKDIPIDDKDYADYLIGKLGWFNNNTGSMAINFFKFGNAPQDVANAFVDGLDMYDQTEDSWDAVRQGLGAMAADPLNYLFGITGAVKAGVVGMARGKILSHLVGLAKRSKNSVPVKMGKAAMVTGGYSGAFSGAKNAATENAAATTEGRDFDVENIVEEVATDTIAGAAVGLGLGAPGAVAKGAALAAPAALSKSTAEDKP